jgi:hypothetical protein
MTKTNITITNERILSFFNNNKNLNVETVLLNTIELMEKLTISSENNSLMLNNILSTVNSNINDTKNILEILKNNNDFIKIKMYEMKDSYINELKETLKNKDNENTINNNLLIDKLTDKINLLLSNQLSSNQEQQLTLLTLKLKQELKNDKLSIENVSDIIDSKYNNIFSLINDMKDLSTKNQLINDELLKFLNKTKVSSSKGLQSENMLFELITRELPTAEIINTSNNTGMGDFIIKRKDKQPILIETKNYNTNVKKDEVDKFLRDVNNNNINGIFISQNTGIVGKDNFQIDIHNKKILIYIHNFNYDSYKLNLAISTIDNLNEKLSVINDNKNINISEELLQEINSEYQNHLLLKEKMVNNLKDYYKKTLDNYNDLSFPCLEKLISKHYANNKKNNLVCDLCKIFETDNNRSLARHKQSCKKKVVEDVKEIEV